MTWGTWEFALEGSSLGGWAGVGPPGGGDNGGSGGRAGGVWQGVRGRVCLTSRQPGWESEFKAEPEAQVFRRAVDAIEVATAEIPVWWRGAHTSSLRWRRSSSASRSWDRGGHGWFPRCSRLPPARRWRCMWGTSSPPVEPGVGHFQRVLQQTWQMELGVLGMARRRRVKEKNVRRQEMERRRGWEAQGFLG